MIPDWLTDSVVADGDCWIWSRSVKHGYGQSTRSMSLSGTRQAHRMVWERTNGLVPSGFELDHAGCQRRACVNPAHLEVVTRAENIRRNYERNVVARRDIRACPHGHAYDESNTYVNPRGSKMCRACARARMARQRALQPIDLGGSSNGK